MNGKIEPRILKEGRFRFLVFPDVPSWFVTDEVGEHVYHMLIARSSRASVLEYLERSFNPEAAQQYLPAFLQRLEMICASLETSVSESSTEPACMRFVNLEVTRKCNLKCKHCHLGNWDGRRSELSIQDITSIFRQASKMGSIHTNITGGEPFVRKDLVDVVDAAFKSNLTVQILTNGTLLTEEVVYELTKLKNRFDEEEHEPRYCSICNYNLPPLVTICPSCQNPVSSLWFQISLEGHSAQVNDTIRGAGSFDMAMKGIKILLNHRIPVNLSLTVTKQNLDDGIPFIRFCEELGINRVRVGSLHRIGRARDFSEIVPTNLELVDYFQSLAKYLEAGCMKPKIYVSEVHGMKGALVNCVKRQICRDGVIHVSAYGDVLYCAYLSASQFCGGNIKEKSLSDIYYNSPAFKQLRKPFVNALGYCKDCVFKLICAGGCRGDAYVEGTGYLGKDPKCQYYYDMYKFHMSSLLNNPSSPRNLTTEALLEDRYLRQLAL